MQANTVYLCIHEERLLIALILPGVYPVFKNIDFLTVPHNCGCAVAQLTTSGEFVQYFYATLEYYKTNIEFQKFIDSAGMDNPFFPPVKIEIAKVKKKRSVKHTKKRRKLALSS